ncbi:hypothetical protein [uncultured Ilumatobacter sp.]|jgi:hypothetical protein|uniref:hypothetical protein n=1 Tax=uncultured Ilumatobacter sp. TaxID=879968 RepID=UPI00374E4C52
MPSAATSTTPQQAVSNAAVLGVYLTYGRDRDSAQIMRARDLLGRLAQLVGDFSIRYEVPELDAKEFHFWQESPNEEGATDEYNWVPCKIFHWDDH